MSEKRIQQPYYLILGEILRPHGIRGELRLKVQTDYPERMINELETVYIGRDPHESEATEYTIQSARFHQEYILLQLKEVQDRNAAELLRGLYVMVDLENAVPLEEDEFYLFELIGLTVKTTSGEELGTIQDILETGANDVYIVKGRKYGELLVPAHDETLIDVDVEAGIVTMNLPYGILPNEAETDDEE
jgi:16S rRNA processing protein RimM